MRSFARAADLAKTSPRLPRRCCWSACRPAGTPGRRCSDAHRAALQPPPSCPAPAERRYAEHDERIDALLRGLRRLFRRIAMPRCSASAKSIIQRMPASIAGWSGRALSHRADRDRRPVPIDDAAGAARCARGGRNRHPALRHDACKRRALPAASFLRIGEHRAGEARFASVPKGQRDVRWTQHRAIHAARRASNDRRAAATRRALPLRLVAGAPHLLPEMLAEGLLLRGARARTSRRESDRDRRARAAPAAVGRAKNRVSSRTGKQQRAIRWRQHRGQLRRRGAAREPAGALRSDSEVRSMSRHWCRAPTT